MGSEPTGADAYKLVRLANGSMSVHSTLERETFHPVIGPAAEAEALYVGQTRFRERLTALPQNEEFVIWDVGLGAAANVAAVLRAGAPIASKVRVVSFDKTPAPAWFALENATALGYLEGYTAPLQELLETVQASTDGVGSITFQNGRQHVDWALHVADFPTWIADHPRLAAPHLILFDAFSPARNPEMWTLRVFQHLHATLSDQHPCQLPTYSRSTLLRVSLLVAGFFVGRGKATGEKEETTIASNCRDLIEHPLDLEWLGRAQRSTSAEPLHAPIYQQRPLSPATREQLLKHPQFLSLEPIGRSEVATPSL